MVERFARNHTAGLQESLKRCRFLKTFCASYGCMHSRSSIKPDLLGAMENSKRGHKEGSLGKFDFFSSMSVLYSVFSIHLSGSQLRIFSSFSWYPFGRFVLLGT